MKCEECFTDEYVTYSEHYNKQLCVDCYNEYSEAEDQCEQFDEMENDK
jgi:hypothetical protein